MQRRKRTISTRRARRLDTEGHGKERDWGMGQEKCERGGAERSGVGNGKERERERERES
jgi:hypothetical protein